MFIMGIVSFGGIVHFARFNLWHYLIFSELQFISPLTYFILLFSLVSVTTVDVVRDSIIICVVEFHMPTGVFVIYFFSFSCTVHPKIPICCQLVVKHQYII